MTELIVRAYIKVPLESDDDSENEELIDRILKKVGSVMEFGTFKDALAEVGVFTSGVGVEDYDFDTDYRMPMEKYEVVDHGVDHAQYFRGQGIVGTDFDFSFVGAGYSAHAALQDAIDQAASATLAIDHIKNTLSKEVPAELENQPEDGELHYYVSLLLKSERTADQSMEEL